MAMIGAAKLIKSSMNINLAGQRSPGALLRQQRPGDCPGRVNPRSDCGAMSGMLARRDPAGVGWIYLCEGSPPRNELGWRRGGFSFGWA
jgi:hypothetical protein